MARVTNLVIPPSLLDSYLHLLVPRDRCDQPDESVQLRGTIYHPIQTDTRPLVLRHAREAAAWLGDEHASGMTRRARQDFETTRVNEILDRDFTAPYWAEATSVADETQSLPVTCVLDVDGVGPAYQDPLRRASWCTEYKGTTTYANPAPHTSPPNPSAGWYGDVAATQFEDRWFAQKHHYFDFPVVVGTNGTVPLWADVSVTLELSASFRGNRMWASTVLAATPAPSFPFPTAANEYGRAMIVNGFIYRLPLDPPATPWSQTIVKDFPIDLRKLYADPSYASATKMVFWVGAIPPHGRYFSRNDWCQCWLTSTAVPWYATPP